MKFSFEQTCVDCGLVGGKAKFFRGTHRCHACSRQARSEAHGWSTLKYDRVYEEQEGRCAICRKETPDLVIDHDHTSGFRRGLLCATCNTGLGQFKDNRDYLFRAIDYLDNAMKRNFDETLRGMEQK